MKQTKYLLAILLVLVLFGVAVLPAALDHYAKSKIIDAIGEGCPRCRIEIESVAIGLLTGSVSAQKIVFADAPEHPTTIDFHLKSIQADVNFWSLRDAMTEIKNLRIEELELTATDDAQKVSVKGEPFPVGDDDELANLPPLHIQNIDLKNCAFTYASRGVDRKRAHLSVYDINGYLRPIITRPAGDTPIRSHIAARFEQSGSVLIDLEIHPFIADHHDKISIQIEHQNLKDLDPMFAVEDGIDLNGIVDRVRADMVVHRGRVRGQIKMKYHGLKLDLKQTSKRSAAENLLAQVIQKLVVIPSRPKDEKDDPVAPVDTAREPNQSIFQFLLAGIKPALAKLVTKI